MLSIAESQKLVLELTEILKLGKEIATIQPEEKHGK